MPGPLVRVTGMNEIRRNLREEDKRYQDALGAAVYSVGLHIIGESVKVAPKDTGRLRTSHYAKPVERQGQKDCEIGYGVHYAMYVHEMPATNNFQAPGSGPKFLERPLKEFKARYPRAVQNATQKFYAQRAGTRSVNANGVPRNPKEQ